MQVKVHSIHFDADKKLLDFLEERVNKLEVFYDRIIDGEVFLRLDKSDNRENKLVEIKLGVPGKDLFAKKSGKTFEEAADLTVEALRRQIKKHRAKIEDH
jgi:putative sigma-54 modulation protein